MSEAEWAAVEREAQKAVAALEVTVAEATSLASPTEQAAELRKLGEALTQAKGKITLFAKEARTDGLAKADLEARRKPLEETKPKTGSLKIRILLLQPLQTGSDSLTGKLKHIARPGF